MSGVVAAARPLAPSWRDYLELSKARIVLMVLITTAAGYAVAAEAFDALVLLHTIIGTAFVAGGTNALNQYFERGLDKKMARTRLRPLPDGRMTERAALLFSVFISVFGTAYLAVLVNPLAAALALTTLITYLFVYTPLKMKTTWCTLIGAVPGAIPPMIGWTAARGTLEPGAWMLFGILALWQMPHFFAIGWIYREDYARAGFEMLSVKDGDGRATGRQAVLYALAIIPVSVLPFAGGMAGISYLVTALAGGLLFVAAAFRFAQTRTSRDARRLFHLSNLYLVVVMASLVLSASL